MSKPTGNPHPRRLYFAVLASSFFMVALLTALAVLNVKVLAAVRAYVGGESLWSKGRGQAVLHLIDYADTHDGADFAAFQRNLNLLLSYRRAREEIVHPSAQTDQVRAQVIAGGIHPDDFDTMLAVFRCFGQQARFKGALSTWAQGDLMIDQLRSLGHRLHHEIQASASPSQVRITLGEIHRLNEALVQNGLQYSAILASASRWTERSLIVSLVLLAVLLWGATVVLVRRMIRQQARHQRELQEAHRRWRSTVAEAGLGLYELDAASQAIELDAQAASLLGLGSTATVIAREQLGSLLSDEDRAAARHEVGAALAGGHGFKLRFALAHSRGGGRWIESVGRQDPGATPAGRLRLSGVLRDVTDERTQALLASERDAARKVAHSQREFLSRLSHELRTPLNAILGFAQLLSLSSAPALSSAQARHAQWILNAGRQLLALIEDVLDLSKVESGEISMTLQPVDLAALLHASIGLVEGVCRQYDVRIVDRSDEGHSGPLWVHADPQRLQQVFINLLSNGCKYNRRGGQLDVRTRRRDSQVGVDFIDQGQGLAPQEVAELFQPFKRMPAAAQQVEGTGLGLYIVKQLVERMHGQVEVESQPGQGSQFSVWLAASAPPPA